MISVVFCSIDPARAAAIERHYERLLGDEPHEIVAIRDARSLAEGYNRGVARASGDIVVLSHDDIEFLDPVPWLGTLKNHLADADLVGIVGTTKVVYGSWARAGPPYTFGQVCEPDGQVAPFRVLVCAMPTPLIHGMQALDGLFMAANRGVLERVRFDEATFDGFHCYDIDFSFSSHLAGFRLAVAADMPVLHASAGNFDHAWEQYAGRFMAKHAANIQPSRRRPFQPSIVGAESKEEALEIMRAPRAQWDAG
jgi:GT2 family glycosyltransferase